MTAAGKLLSFYAAIYFKFKLELKFKANKNYCTETVNLLYGNCELTTDALSFGCFSISLGSKN